MVKIAWTEEAQRWLEDIFEYIATDNPQAAARTVQNIYQRVQILADHPEIGRCYAASSRNVRILLYGHFRIAYLISMTGPLTFWAYSTELSISANIKYERDSREQIAERTPGLSRRERRARQRWNLTRLAAKIPGHLYLYV